MINLKKYVSRARLTFQFNIQVHVYLPATPPYKNIMRSRFVEKVQRNNPAAAMQLPTIATLRAPNLFTNALAIGPEIEITYMYIIIKMYTSYMIYIFCSMLPVHLYL